MCGATNRMPCAAAIQIPPKNTHQLLGFAVGVVEAHCLLLPHLHQPALQLALLPARGVRLGARRLRLGAPHLGLARRHRGARRQLLDLGPQAGHLRPQLALRRLVRSNLLALLVVDVAHNLRGRSKGGGIRLV